jgi:FkbM family methyltransferase
MCRAYRLLSNQSGSDANAWMQLRGYYLNVLRRPLDERSKMTIRYMLNVSYYYFHFAHQIPLEYFSISLNESDDFMAEVPSLKQKFPWVRQFGRHSHMEAFYYRHGLRFCSQTVRDYVHNRDFIDCGASTGDSLSGLDEYTTQRIISYEIFEKTWRIANATASHFALGKHIVLNIGLGKENMMVYLAEEGGGGSGIWNGQGIKPIKITTLDDEVKRLQLDVGFIKADIEGEEFNFLQGSLDTLRKHRPVVNIAIYHTADLLNIPLFFDQFGGFRLSFHTENDGRYDNLHDLRLFAIPDTIDP